ncbi:DUF3427 domain-containing protein [Photobacterium aquae]|uniref:DUF3427 domain-containing protein n=1 Tax=Photobacterium aquae TaxID=1195763 RepID=UPI00069D2A10|nr:DUF3427 domain-containing protein [Photobacterium aquae]
MSTKNENLAVENFVIGHCYSRKDVARVGCVTPPKQDRDWTGIVSFNNCVLLFVTLDKGDFEKDIQYHDYFAEGGELFNWESQNKNTPATPAIKRIIDGETVVLFTRIINKRKGKTQPFVYVGRLLPLEHRNEKPVQFTFLVDGYTSAPEPQLFELYHWKENTLATREKSGKYVVSKGQGRIADAKKKKAIELRAMTTARQYYESLGYHVIDTSSHCPYDFECERGGELRRVEVKGTTQGLGKVTVTYNEVISALDDKVETDLFIVYHIHVVPADDDYQAIMGTTHLISNWNPSNSDLKPIAYEYTLPKPLSI